MPCPLPSWLTGSAATCVPLTRKRIESAFVASTVSLFVALPFASAFTTAALSVHGMILCT
jgi:hypothetical protein